MKTISDLVNEQPLFAGLTSSQRALVAGCGRNRAYEDGSLLMKAGEQANEFFVIRRGKISIAIHHPSRGEVSIETLGAGETIGWSWLFPPYVRQFDARAMSEVRVIAFDAACLRGKCDNDPVLGYALMKIFARVMFDRFEATRLQLLDIYGNAG